MFSVKTTLYTVPPCISISKDQTGGNANIAFGFQRQSVCVCVFSSHPFWTSSSLDVPAGVTVDLKKTPKNISKKQYRALEAMNVLTSNFCAASRFGEMVSARLAHSVAYVMSFLFKQRRTRDKPKAEPCMNMCISTIDILLCSYHVQVHYSIK